MNKVISGISIQCIESSYLFRGKLLFLSKKVIILAWICEWPELQQKNERTSDVNVLKRIMRVITLAMEE